jgi:UDP-GlcNAc:undecaprenyl-phosphate/decaprenyl-phosphate GlcNAc-1-phosphate transferase
MQIVLPFLVALAVSGFATPVVRRVAQGAGYVAPPAADRWHRSPTALFGGVAIFIGLLGGIGFSAAVGGINGMRPADLPLEAVGIILAATVMFVTGVVDDRFGLKPATKLIAQTTAAGLVIAFGVVYPVTAWQSVNVLLTVFWFIAVTNALNLIDNMDGVAAGVAGIAATFLAISFLLNGAVGLAVVCAALAGAAAGFLPYNYHPASIFMGDSGSLVLGSLIAALGAAYPATVPVGIVPVLFVPVFVAVIPILDTLLVTTTRTLAGRPLSEGGRDHTTHRLVALGLTERQVAMLLYGFAAFGGLLALGFDQASVEVSASLGTLFLVGLGLLAVYLSRLHKYAPRSGGPANRRATVLVSDLLHKRRALQVLMDLVLFAAAYHIAYLLRWDGALPDTQRALLGRTIALAMVGKSVAFGLLGVYRGAWQHIGMSDAHRILRATVLGSLLTTALVVGTYREADFARSVFVLDAVLVLLLVGGARLSFRSLDAMRYAVEPRGVPTLIYGAGRGGEFVMRELQANKQLDLMPIAFIDDDVRKHGLLIRGLPVLGGREVLRSAAAERGVRMVVVGTRSIEREVIAGLVQLGMESNFEVLCFQIDLRAPTASAAAAVVG